MVTENDITTVALDSAGDWDQVATLLPQVKDWGLGILREGLNPYARSVLIEPNYICKDHRSLHSNFYSKKFVERPAKCSRLHFFSRTSIRIAALQFDAPSLQDDYIGFTIIRPVPRRWLGRTIIDPHKVGRAPSHHAYCLRAE